MSGIISSMAIIFFERTRKALWLTLVNIIIVIKITYRFFIKAILQKNYGKYKEKKVGVAGLQPTLYLHKNSNLIN